MFSKKHLSISLISFAVLFLAISVAQAAGPCEPCVDTADCDSGLTCTDDKCRGCPSGQICNPLQACEFEEIAGAIIDFIFRIAIVLAPLMVVVGGAMFVTAGGNVQQLDRGKKLILYTAIGFVIILLSKAVLAMINQILGTG
ncbi:MAG: hypothetical protein ABIG08_01695 [bacterium]